jgi:Ca-activated chloride channel homolog
MTFLAPAWLLLLLPVAGLVAAYVVLQRRRRHYAVRFTNLDLLASVAPKRPGWRRHVTAAAAVIGLGALVIALARPARDEEVARDEATVMLVLDTSASMTATDVAPSRLDAARDAAATFIDDLPDGFEVGLVTFDENARVLATPTTDHDAVVAALSQLQPGPGTATGDGIDIAVETIAAALAEDRTETDDPQPGEPGTTDPATGDTEAGDSASIVLLSDGDTTVGQTLDTATQLAVDQGVPVTTIAYGTDTGTVTIEGQIVPVPADEASMEAVAETTGGAFFTAASADELASVYGDIEARIGTEVEQREILRFFVGLAVLALMAAAATSMYWNARFL